MSEQSVPTAVSLLERGHYFLQEEQFKAADLYFNRVLDAEPNNHAAYWGLLLCAYQCRNTAELYTVNAVPFDNNTHYQHALEHADEASAAGYRAVLGATLLACHARILEHYEAGNAFLLEQWFAHYRASEAKDPTFAALHKLINKNGKPARMTDPTTAAALLAFDRLYDAVDTSPDKVNELVDKLRATVKRLYTAAMTQSLDDLTRLHPAAPAALDQWTQPAAAELLPKIDLSAAHIGLDGNGETVAARYMVLAAALENTAHKTDEDCATILYCYEQAEVHAASDDECQAAEAAKRAYSDRAVAAQDTTANVILYFMEKFPQNGDYCRRYVAYQTVNYSKKLTSYPTDKALSNFLDKKRDEYTADTAAEMAQKQLTRIADTEQEYAAHLADVTPYADKALALLTEPQAFKTEWETYCARIREQYEKTLATLHERHGQVVQKQQTDDKAGTSGATAKGIIATIASYLAVCLSVPLLLCGLYTLNNPTELLRYPLIPAFLIALGVCLVLHFIKRAITKKLKKYRPTKYALPKACSVLLGLAPTLSLLFSLTCATLFVYSFITLPARAGTVPIATAEELVYIKNAPHVDFVLTADIDLEGAAFPKTFIRTGDLDGDGHTVSNIAIDGHLIRINRGTIQNLTLKSVKHTDDGTLILKNDGTLREITVSDIILDDEGHRIYGIAGTNKGRIESCAVKSVNGQCSSFIGIANQNRGEILACTVSGVKVTAQSQVAGIADVNRAKIAGCSFEGTVSSFWIHGIARVLRGDEAVVEQCSSSGNYSGDDRVAGLIGEIEDTALVENCYSVAKLTLTPINAVNSYAIGLVGSIRDIDKEKCATVRNCYFGGSITTKSGKGAHRYGYVGAMIGNTYPLSDHANYQRDYYIEFGGCFAVASYSFGVERAYQSDSHLPIKTETSYFTSSHDLSEILTLYNDTNITNKNKLLNKTFLTGTLGWDAEIWNIQNGKLPTLKPYVIPADETAADNTAAEEGSK